MAYLTNPNLAYILVVVGITLFFLAQLQPKSMILKGGMVFCLLAFGLELLYLRVNPWAFLVVALSPLPFMIAVRQGRAQNTLFLISIAMLVMGSFFLFLDQDYQPLVSLRLVWISILCAIIIWISTQRLRNVNGIRLSDAADSLIGMIGETKMEIEAHATGLVLVDGELWPARSKTPIPSGSMVRVIRHNGYWLTVKKAKKLTKG